MTATHPGYRSSQSQTNTHRSVCMHPGCDFFAVTELRSSALWDAHGSRWITLCNRHRSKFDGLTLTELRAIRWRKRRKRYV